MQRVSTAFVGQVSAASSPAVAKLKGLTTAAEAVRARVLAGDAGWTLSRSSRSRAKQGARFERSTSRPPPSATFAEVVARIAAEEAAGRPGILHQWHSSLPSKPSKTRF